MEALVLDEPTPPRPPLRLVRTGPRGRDDVFRPKTCPDGHVGRIRIDRITSNGPFYTRVGYRCARREWDTEKHRWVEVRHRFTERAPEDPLPRRHPTHEHSSSREQCPTCEHTYAPDDGPRIGRRFAFIASEGAALLMGIAKGHPIRESVADVRRDALRFRPPTRSHRGIYEDDPRADVLEWLTNRVAHDDEHSGPLWEDTDWDARFHPELAEDAPHEPDWLGDLPELPPADPEARLREHMNALLLVRYGDPKPRPAATPDMTGDERYLSRSFALGGEYVDVFGPAVIAPYRADIWPSVITIDSQPIRRRALVETDEDARVASDFLCEIFAVADGTTKELILLYPAGGKDQESIKEVFATKHGAPSWIVTDGDLALAAAIRATFPDAIHYRCEDHLRKDGEEAAVRDAITDGQVLGALYKAQRSPERWNTLKAIVEQKVPAALTELRTWMAANEDLVLHQCELRELYLDMPRSTGGIENDLVWIRSALALRKTALRNRRRLSIVLELMRLHRSHKARHDQFTLLIRRALEANGRAKIPWSDYWDPMIRNRRGKPIEFRNSLIEHRDMARERNAQARSDAIRQDSLERKVIQIADARAKAIEAGGAPVGRARRATQRKTAAREGDMIADVPELMKFWDFEANAGIDPTTIPAQSRREVAWICRDHAHGDPDGRWPGHLHQWRQSAHSRAGRNGGCRFCLRRMACEGNSLRITHPHLADPAQWDYETNDAADVTPDNQLSGSNKVVSWLCERHGRYELKIQARATMGQPCTQCSDEVREQKRRETTNAKRRARYRPAAGGRERR